jgi:alpha-tubulin suppressor-like RCC1 family protein
VRAACGVWHTAAVVEVMVGNSSSSNCSSGKIFTWGDGDKGRLGHGDKESRLVPTCVAALVEPNFCQVVCGQCLTVALTTSGHVYTMGSAVYGQLGNPQADGMLPVRVEGKLHKNFVEEISCGAYHVAILTSRTEVYTWGKGANGRLGHGNTDDKNTPTLVEALKDKQVRSVVCGTNFTAAICIHKWVSGVDQLMCSGCRQPFNLRRKRHNCYNCALIFCHSCSS